MSIGTSVASKESVPHVASSVSLNPSPSSSVSVLFPTPSPSVSVSSFGSNGKASSGSNVPSPSSSVSIQFAIPSESVSKGTSVTSKESVPHVASSASLNPSLSSSVSV